MMTLTPTPTLTDSDLLDRCLTGDRNAYRWLVERYQSLVCSVAYAVVGDLRLSEDVAQEAFVTAWRKLPTLESRKSFRFWLCGIARNLAHHALRGRKPEAPLSAAATHPSPDPTPAEHAASREEEAIVHSALMAMPEAYREPLVLFYREDQSVAAVAEALDLSPDAVKQRLSRGREMLRDRVADVIEGTLRRTRPGTVFTAAVMAALPGVVVATAAATATTANAASLGKAAAAPLAKAALTAGLSGALWGALGGLSGGLFGAWASVQSAQYERQRRHLIWQIVLFLIAFAIFVTPFVAMLFGWRPFAGHPLAYVIVYFVWMLHFGVGCGVWAWRLGKTSRRILAEEVAAGTPPLPKTPLRRWMGAWQGRQYRSRLTLLGLPLLDVNFGNPDRLSADHWDPAEHRAKVARGWIAIGERAYGVLFAFGNIAIAGGFALGGVACGGIALGGVVAGILPIGGVALGVLPFSGISAGVGAIGGLAVGYWAFGGAAFAWQAARGGVAVAHGFADSGQSTVAHAAHANDAAAHAYFAQSSFFHLADVFQQRVIPILGQRWFITAWVAFSLLMPVAFWLVGYRRRR